MRYTLGAMEKFKESLRIPVVAAGLSLLLSASGYAAPAGGAGYKGPAWTPKDSAEAAGFIRSFRQHPEKIESLVAGPGNMSRGDQDLGFGYRLKEVWVNPAGKLGFSLKILSRIAGPVSFEVKPIQNYSALAPKYQTVLRSAFPQAKGAGDGNFPAYLPYHWNLAAASAPLPADSLSLPESAPMAGVQEALSYYMTPYSGTTYGIRGGRGGQILENRDRFMSLGDTLMMDKTRALYLLRSLNPASRLTAAEFIIRHRSDFRDFENLSATALKRVFANPAKVETMRGERVSLEDARRLAYEYAHMEVKRTGRGVFRQ